MHALTVLFLSLPALVAAIESTTVIATLTAAGCASSPSTPITAAICCHKHNLHCALLGHVCAPTGPHCTRGLVCLLSELGLSAAGTCRALNSPPVCSVLRCAFLGFSEPCALSSFVTTCGVWAKPAAGHTVPSCNITCPSTSCRPVRAADGTSFCTVCELIRASCRSRFQLFGPVETEAPQPQPSLKAKAPEVRKEPTRLVVRQKEATVAFTASPLAPILSEGPVPDACSRLAENEWLRGPCCDGYGVACLGEGESCFTNGASFRGLACARGLTCLVSDFGFPAADESNSGFCRDLESARVEPCTVEFCTRYGQGAYCELHEEYSGAVTTCRVWATPSKEISGPNCDLACTEECWSENNRPLGSDGVRYCTLCSLQVSSCKSGFWVYGPLSGEDEKDLETSAPIAPSPEISSPAPFVLAIACSGKPIPSFLVEFCCEEFNMSCK